MDTCLVHGHILDKHVPPGADVAILWGCGPTDGQRDKMLAQISDLVRDNADVVQHSATSTIWRAGQLLHGASSTERGEPLTSGLDTRTIIAEPVGRSAQRPQGYTELCG